MSNARTAACHVVERWRDHFGPPRTEYIGLRWIVDDLSDGRDLAAQRTAWGVSVTSLDRI